MSLDSRYLEAYQRFANAVDDYFEYRCLSEQDQKFVHDAMRTLTDQLTHIAINSEVPVEDSDVCPECGSSAKSL